MLSLTLYRMEDNRKLNSSDTRMTDIVSSEDGKKLGKSSKLNAKY